MRITLTVMSRVSLVCPLPYTVITNLRGERPGVVGRHIFAEGWEQGVPLCRLHAWPSSEWAGPVWRGRNVQRCLHKKNYLGSYLAALFMPAAMGSAELPQNCTSPSFLPEWRTPPSPAWQPRAQRMLSLPAFYFRMPLLWLTARSPASSMTHFCISFATDQEGQGCRKKRANKWVKSL